MSPKGKKKPRHHWAQLDERYLGGEWTTVREMAKRTGISENTIEKHLARKGMAEERRKIDGDARAEAATALAHSKAERLIELDQRLTRQAKALQSLGLTNLFDTDAKTGEMKPKRLPVTTSAALMALARGMELERRIVMGLPEKPVVDEAEVLDSGNIDRLNELTDDQLSKIIADDRRRRGAASRPKNCG
jgi:hypothetical protein